MVLGIYIFANEIDITEQILGNRNLFSVPSGSEMGIPISFESSLDPVVISVTVIDATALDNFFLSDNYHNSRKVARVANDVAPINVSGDIAGEVGRYDPYPELATTGC